MIGNFDKLRDYQKEDVKKITEVGCLGIFSEQRTGKTPTALIGMANLCQGSNFLVVCPNTLVYNWAHEVSVWLPQYTAVVITKQQVPEHENVPTVWVVNYEKVAHTKTHMGLLPQLMKLGKGLIIDEAHRIKNPQAAVSKAIITLSHKFTYKLALTGTPAHDKPEDIFNILRYLDFKTYRSYYSFIEEWCRMKTVYTARGDKRLPDGIRKDKEDAFVHVLDSLAIMHKRTEVMNWDTSMDIIDITLPINAQQRKYLKQLGEIFECTDGKTTIETQGILDRLIRYRQVCSAPAILNLKGKSPKLEWLEQYLHDNKDTHLLVFSNSKKLLNYCCDTLHNKYVCEIIDGSVKAKHRQEIVQDFQAGKIQCLFLQTQACKEGLTLDKADTTVFMDVYPPASDYLQAKDRAVPTSPDKVKVRSVYRLMMQNTYDQTLYTLVDDNIDASKVINDFINYLK